MSAFIVTPDAERPAGTAGRCFYCQREVGAKHDPACVLIKRRVRIRMTVEYEVDVPACWTDEDIEFHRNDGTWCANNALTELDALFGSEDGPCLCVAAKFAYVAEAGLPRLEEG